MLLFHLLKSPMLLVCPLGSLISTTFKLTFHYLYFASHIYLSTNHSRLSCTAVDYLTTKTVRLSALNQNLLRIPSHSTFTLEPHNNFSFLLLKESPLATHIGHLSFDNNSCTSKSSQSTKTASYKELGTTSLFVNIVKL